MLNYLCMNSSTALQPTSDQLDTVQHRSSTTFIHQARIRHFYQRLDQVMLDGNATGLHKETSDAVFQQGVEGSEANAELSQYPLHEMLFGENALAALSGCAPLTPCICNMGLAQAAICLQGQQYKQVSRGALKALLAVV
jgi:hypothetical protein